MTNSILTSPTQFQKKLLLWFDQKGRKNLPWQQDRSPYRVWVSEIMLQQTQVSTVIPYYERFMNRFPSVQSLADASEDEVLHYWTGLGYYSRARNLLETAKRIQQLTYFPDTLEGLEQLPGIGRSTAGAILAIAFEKRAAILDGNVKRVLTRLTALNRWPGENEILIQLWTLAEKLTPTKRVADYTQAIMDLGATLCTRSKPQCDQCPFEQTCQGRQLGIEKSLPVTKPKKEIPTKQATFFIFKYKNFILLENRSSNGVWKGLWSFPEAPKKLTLMKTKSYIQKYFLCSIEAIRPQNKLRHTFSHFHLNIFPMIININKKTILDTPKMIWYDLNKPQTVGLPSPVKKIISMLEPKQAQPKLNKKL